MRSRPIGSILLMIMTFILLGACGSIPQATQSVVTPTQIPEVMADCFLSFHAAAWQDMNADGIWDQSESSLQGVEFDLQGPYAQKWDPAPYPDKGEGWYTIQTWAPGECIPGEFILSASAPDSYQATTSASMTFSSSGPFEARFGFQPLP